MKTIDVQPGVSLEISDGKTYLVIAFDDSKKVTTSEGHESLIAMPTLDEVLSEASRLKEHTRPERGFSDVEIEIRSLREAHRNLLRASDCKLLNVHRNVLKAIVTEEVQLYQFTSGSKNLTQAQHQVRIEFDAMREMRHNEQDELPLKGGASLHKLGCVLGVHGFGTFGYYDPRAKILLLIPVDVGRRANDALKNHQSNRHAPAAERPLVGQTAPGRNRPRNS
ncbi:MAG: hypothetical protein ABIO72_03580 [Patescibacteria group bacterium]